MKPIEGTYAENCQKYGCGGINIDGCRISGVVNSNPLVRNAKGYESGGLVQGEIENGSVVSSGRFPSHLILSHTPDCECVGEKKVKGSHDGGNPIPRRNGEIWGNGNANADDGAGFAGSDGKETVSAFRCATGCPCGHVWTAEKLGPCPACRCTKTEWLCPVAKLDQQAGNCGAAAPVRGHEESTTGGHGTYGHYDRVAGPFHADSVGPSRFFYQAKASRSERNIGCEGLYWRRDESVPYGFVQIDKAEYEKLGVDEGAAKARGEQVSLRAHGNIHITVKSIGLMRWLCRLISSPVGTKIVDPFMGSGSTGVACVHEGFEFTGIDLYPENCEIAKRRITPLRKRDSVPQKQFLISLSGCDPTAILTVEAQPAFSPCFMLGLSKHL